jgi:hypothetical protein
MTANPKRDVEIFAEAIQLPTEQRIVFLDRVCAGDKDLRQRIEALLRSNDRAGDFMEEPPTGSLSEGRARIAGEKPGDRVNRYKLLQQIGEGGCGVVFMAEQEEPIRRRVALKVVKPGMDTKSVIARFEAERQALALMEHPNIAHVFDAGATDSGRPWPGSTLAAKWPMNSFEYDLPIARVTFPRRITMAFWLRFATMPSNLSDRRTQNSIEWRRKHRFDQPSWMN